MKYLEKAREQLKELIEDFIKNETEDTEEYTKILSVYNEINYYVETKRLKNLDCKEMIWGVLDEVMEDTMQVFDFGAKKHPDSGDTPNFLTPEGNKCSLKARGLSVLRHATRTFMHPGVLDEESGLNELLHLISSASILYIRQKRGIVYPGDTYERIQNY